MRDFVVPHSDGDGALVPHQNDEFGGPRDARVEQVALQHHVRTANFTMTAFTRMHNRETRLFGARGKLTCDGRFIHHYNFMIRSTETLDTETNNASILDGP